MLKSLRSLWGKGAQTGEEDNGEARKLSDEIVALEAQLEKDPRNSEAQKQLMLTYNRALKVFARHPDYRQQVDVLFERIDQLRNVIRRNI